MQGKRTKSLKSCSEQWVSDSSLLKNHVAFFKKKKLLGPSLRNFDSVGVGWAENLLCQDIGRWCCTFNSIAIEHRFVGFLHKGPDAKYFRLCSPIGKIKDITYKERNIWWKETNIHKYFVVDWIQSTTSSEHKLLQYRSTNENIIILFFR